MNYILDYESFSNGIEPSLLTNANTAPGVDPTGNSECSGALQDVFDSNIGGDGSAAAKIVRLQGVFNIANTLIIKGNVDASNAVFNYSGSGVAVQIGNSVVGQLTRLKVLIGQIVCTSKPAGPNWIPGSVGLKVSNVFRSVIAYQNILNFETGLLEYGDGTYGQQGTAYNRFECGTLNNNLVNQSFQISPSGFVNQNTHLGGSWAHSDGTYPVAGMRHILMGVAGTVISCNNNVWLNASLEGSMEQYIIESNGTDNTWINCRYETVGHNPPVLWNERAARNTLIGGYQVDLITASIVSGAVSNNMIGTQSVILNMTSAGGLMLSAASGGSSAALSVMRADWQRLGDTPANNYTAQLLPSRWHLKTASDIADRILIDGINRGLTFGDGTGTYSVSQTWGVGTPNAVVIANPGALNFNYSAGSTGFGLYMKASGSGTNTGWQSIGFLPFTTASRPVASLAGIGGTYFDTTLNKPIWSDGTVWRDATGAAV